MMRSRCITTTYTFQFKIIIAFVTLLIVFIISYAFTNQIFNSSSPLRSMTIAFLDLEQTKANCECCNIRTERTPTRDGRWDTAHMYMMSGL